MKIKKVLLLIIALTMVLTLSACFNKAPEDNDNNNQPEDPVVETTNIKLYYANKEYIESGDEDLDRLVAVEKEVDLNNKPVEEVILEELQEDPQDENLTTMLKKVTILGVKIDGDIAYVDFSSENLSGGSLEESFILSQVVYSLTELEDIEAVQFLVDSKEQESLMGHITIDQPLSRQNM